MHDQPAEPPFIRLGSETPASPVVLSVPHAGRDYSPALLRSARIPREKLEALEDRLVDRLIWRAVADGAAAIVARTPRAEIDLNRDEREIDPSTVVPPPPLRDLLQSPRTRGGLGLIPSRLAGSGSIWLHRIPQDEVRRRIEIIHRPYHTAVEQALHKAKAAFGIAILLDCHSMPPKDGAAKGAAPLIFGDRHGTSAGRDLVEAAVGAARRAGYATACNTPYAGGYVTSHHGRPAENVHAIQLEIDRSLYLAGDLRTPGPRFDDIAGLIALIAAALAEKASGPEQAIAAE
ncbi:MAG TPA: N-formylglutamate amidohydrolase [Allosphingosinicella sp.]|uniref:N-formylglutamate amidohydrolase n=1 Tax=Allosphingosinicella sp. TaxID=2823234 RepID=UPI002EDA2750